MSIENEWPTSVVEFLGNHSIDMTIDAHQNDSEERSDLGEAVALPKIPKEPLDRFAKAP